MAIATIDDLILTIQDFLVGHAISDTAAIGFIAMAEAGFGRSLRMRQMVRRAGTLLVNGYCELPSDCLSPINFSLSRRPGVPLRMVSPDRADLIRAAQPTGGIPQYFAVVGTELEVLPNPQGTWPAELVYFGMPRPLARTTNPSNIILQLAPDLYLNASLGIAASYVNDSERAQFWTAEAQRLTKQLNDDAAQAAYGASPLLMRPRKTY